MRAARDTEAAPGRDRSAELVLPAAPRRIGTACAWCGKPLAPNHHGEHYANRYYCDSDCHRAGRRADAAENRKRRVVRRVVTPAQALLTAPACRVCGRDGATVRFSRDASRQSGWANLCAECESEKYRAYYQKPRERLRKRSREQNRVERRASKSTSDPVPAGVEITPRKLRHAQANLADIVRAVPVDAGLELLAALDEGKVNGALFEDRAGCGCLWGTIGRACRWGVTDEHAWAQRFRAATCAEVDLFGRISPGDTPATNPYAAVCAATIRATLATRVQEE